MLREINVDTIILIKLSRHQRHCVAKLSGRNDDISLKYPIKYKALSGFALTKLYDGHVHCSGPHSRGR